MTKRVEPEIPSITLDKDQVEGFKNQRSSTPTAKNAKSTNQGNATASSSKINNFFTTISFIGLAGAAFFFYQENVKIQLHLLQSEERIQQLENQLSATGEEMGESTVALKVKLEAITKKSEELWSEMDKLWASAWRRNQSEIKELRSSSKKHLATYSANQKSTSTSLKSIQDRQTSADLNLNALNDQLSAASGLQNKIDNVMNELASLDNKASNRDEQQMEIATMVNQLDMSVKALIERLERLEQKTPVTP